MKPLLAGVCLVILVLVGMLWAQDAPPSSIPVEQLPVATQGLVNSSLSLALTPGVPYRARRLVTLAEMARGLDEGHPEANRILADLYAAHELPTQSAEALRHYLVGREKDYALWQRWLDSALAEHQTAEDRINFLTEVIQVETIPSTVRAEATIDYAEILAGQGKDKEVSQLLVGSLRLDPYNRRALVAWGEQNSGSISVTDSANVMCRILRGSPQDFNVAYDMGAMLGQVGLWKQSAAFYGHAWSLLEAEVGQDEVPYDWTLAYCNALLDAGEYQKAIDQFKPMLEDYPGRVDLPSLLIEAHLALGQNEDAKTLVTGIESDHSQIEGDTVQADLEMAMFYLVVKPDSNRAITLARAAIRGADETQRRSVPLQRVYGATELLGGAVESGVARLEAIQGTDMWASAFLANYYYHIEKTEDAKREVRKGLALGRSGPAARRLRVLAGELGMQIEPMAGSAKIAQMINNFGEYYLQMPIHPERFVELTIDGPSEPVVVGEPINLTCRLKNVGPVALPTGPMGLFEPVMAVKVFVAGLPEDVDAEFDQLPLAVWPCPRYLRPDQEVTCQVQLDVGELNEVLEHYPLSQLKIEVTGILNPVQKGQEMVSDLPILPSPTATVERDALFKASSNDDGDVLSDRAEAFLAEVGTLVDSEAFADRVLAARQIGSLQVFIDRLSFEDFPEISGLPVIMLDDRIKPMIAKLLTDESPVVRATMVESLADAGVTMRLEAVDVCHDDPAALVRIRVVEILGTLKDEDSRSKLASMTRDPDEHVARMAELFQEIQLKQSESGNSNSSF